MSPDHAAASRLITAMMREAGRVDALHEAGEEWASPPRLVRLVESRSCAADRDAPELVELARTLRRRQPARTRQTALFARGAEWVRLSKDWSAFVLWAVGGEPGSSSWFADRRIWTARPAARMAAVFMRGGDELPIFAFDPFSPAEVRSERVFRWCLVGPDGEPLEVPQ